MRLTVVGCSGSYAGPTSPASCYLLSAEHEGRSWRLVLDLGNGALGPLQTHLDPVDLDAVLLSHLHPDHCADMCGLFVMFKYRPGGPLERRMRVHGPQGTAERLAELYGNLGPEGMTEHFDFRTSHDTESFEVGPFRVTPHLMNHPVECYGYRVECDGAVLAFTGDTDSTPNLTPLLTGADLVLMDAAFVDGRDEPRGIHLTGSRAAQAAVDAGGVDRLVLTHLPAWNDPEVCRAQAATVWPGRVELAEAGRTYALGEDAPAGHPRMLHTVLDATDCRGLAEFYRELLGLAYRPGDEPPSDGSADDADWLVLTDRAGRRQLAVQQVDSLTPTTWPSGEVPMQLHVDYVVPTVADVHHQRERAEALGARVLLDRTDDPDEPLFVLADPAGHPFCVFVG